MRGPCSAWFMSAITFCGSQFLCVGLLLVAVMISICGCVATGEAHVSQKHVCDARRQWQGQNFDRVVGYNFTDLPTWSTIVCTRSGKLNLAGLRDVKHKKVVLSAAQIDELFDAIFGKHSPPAHAMCYEPHHIFIFFEKDQPVGAFEICFRCSDYRAWPCRTMKVNESYPKLNALCKKLGLSTRAP